jgi:hypothetical protein
MIGVGNLNKHLAGMWLTHHGNNGPVRYRLGGRIDCKRHSIIRRRQNAASKNVAELVLHDDG